MGFLTVHSNQSLYSIPSCPKMLFFHATLYTNTSVQKHTPPSIQIQKYTKTHSLYTNTKNTKTHSFHKNTKKHKNTCHLVYKYKNKTKHPTLYHSGDSSRSYPYPTRIWTQSWYHVKTFVFLTFWFHFRIDYLLPLLDISNGWYTRYETKLGVIENNKLTCQKNCAQNYFLANFRKEKQTVREKTVVGLVS